MHKIIIGLSLALFSVVATAEPVYLDCELFNSESEKSVFSVKLDEDNGKVTHSTANGYGLNAEGFFKVDEISYQQISVFSGIKMTQRWTISRIDLSASKVTEMVSIEFPDKIKPEILTMEGACKMVKVKSRQF
ncbi:hypothetical protein [Pseudidiomarina gelatinasegens]|uniref:hypothetical protein n=1 Tax=Pseudidiomarina gelatinasegens TaxID=2487740 RepID=UPI0030ED4D5E|tara:strand:+ start:3239 stop:3637 length:399 start_codon:yes stop_codon:yes gene_type:complete